MHDDLIADRSKDGIDIGSYKGVGKDIFRIALEDLSKEGDVFLLVCGDEVSHCLNLRIVFVSTHQSDEL